VRGWSHVKTFTDFARESKRHPHGGGATPQHNSQWAADFSIAEKVGCRQETLRNWVSEHERNTGQRPGPTTDAVARIKDLERENRELRRANEILKKASAYFALAELDRRAT
jgi:hypothetical protein